MVNYFAGEEDNLLKAIKKMNLQEAAPEAEVLSESSLKDVCMKEKNGKKVPNCVPKEKLEELSKDTLHRYAKKAAADSFEKYEAAKKALRSKDPQKDIKHNELENKSLDRMDKAKKALKKVYEEDLNELSKETLGSYVKKASDQAQGAAYDRGHSDAKWKLNAKAIDKQRQRNVGITKAVNKLTEEQLNELSKKTLGSYVKKASFDSADKAFSAGERFGQTRKTGETYKQTLKKSNDRQKYIRKAADKLTEEVSTNPNESTIVTRLYRWLADYHGFNLEDPVYRVSPAGSKVFSIGSHTIIQDKMNKTCVVVDSFYNHVCEITHLSMFPQDLEVGSKYRMWTPEKTLVNVTLVEKIYPKFNDIPQPVSSSDEEKEQKPTDFRFTTDEGDGSRSITISPYEIPLKIIK